MSSNPNNYFSGGTGAGPRPCECCKKLIVVDWKSPSVFGSGRFCSSICSKLRSPEKHWNWLVDHPNEMKEWQEWRREQDSKPDRDERILPL